MFVFKLLAPVRTCNKLKGIFKRVGVQHNHRQERLTNPRNPAKGQCRIPPKGFSYMFSNHRILTKYSKFLE